MPNSANGARLGLIRTNGAANRDDPATASAIAAIDQMTGLPVHVLRIVVGFEAHSASNGQTSGRGASRATTHAVTASGIAHHAMTSSCSIPGTETANGRNSHSATGG